MLQAGMVAVVGIVSTIEVSPQVTLAAGTVYVPIITVPGVVPKL